MWKLWIVTGFFLIVFSMPSMTAIAFLSDRDGKSNVYVMNDDGGNVRQITHTPFRKGDLMKRFYFIIPKGFSFLKK